MKEKLNLCILMLSSLGNHKESFDKLIEILKRFRLEYFYFRNEYLFRWWPFIYKKPMLYKHDTFMIVPQRSIYFFQVIYFDFRWHFTGKTICLTILNCEIWVVWNWLIYSMLQIVNFNICGNQCNELFSLEKKFCNYRI